jgi:hypothetical protein
VIHALTGEPIAGVEVRVSGAADVEAETDGDGVYLVDEMPGGSYFVTVVAPGFVPETEPVVLGDGPRALDFVLCPALGPGQYRAVLCWDEPTADLDAHLFTAGGGHLWFADRGSAEKPPHITFDRDDVDGSGPETITIHRLEEGCEYYVHGFSGKGSIRGSEAEVRVYGRTGLLGSFEAPESGDGGWWYVFDMNAEGAVTARGVLTETIPAR